MILAADCRKRKVILSILPYFSPYEDPLDETHCFCYDVPALMPAIPRVGIGNRTSVVKPTEVW